MPTFIRECRVQKTAKKLEKSSTEFRNQTKVCYKLIQMNLTKTSVRLRKEEHEVNRILNKN